MRITAYKVVTENDVERFEKKVNELIKAGWQPHGSMLYVPTTTDEHYDWMYQPMVKVDSAD